MNQTFRVLVLDGVSATGVDVLAKDDSFSVTTHKGSKVESEVIELIRDFDGVVVRSNTTISANVIASAPRLKVIGRAGVGVDNVNVAAATERGIVVMNTPGGNTISTAEHTFSLMLALARGIPQAHASMVAGKWDRKSLGVEMQGKVLGIAGMGRIGGEVARRAIAFGMRVIAFDPYLALARARSMQVELADTLEPLLKEADFITLHMPMTKETNNMLNATTLAQCKKGVRIINCARGGLVNEADLLEALKSGHVAGAALDVYESEPPPADFGFRSLPNVVLTPHLAASTSEAQESVGIEIAEAVRDFLKGGVVRNAVNASSLDGRMLAVLKPYLAIGEKLGRLLSQLAPRRLDSLLVKYSGRVNELDTTPVTRAVLLGLLRQSGGNEVNDINAPIHAKNLGLEYSETKSSEPSDFAELITVEACAGGTKHTLAATFFGSQARIVRIDGHSLDANPSGVLFIMENQDRPGIVGWIGTLLGRHNINIASMSLSRTTPGSRALSILNLDSEPGAEVLKEIQADPDIVSVKVVTL